MAVLVASASGVANISIGLSANLERGQGTSSLGGVLQSPRQSLPSEFLGQKLASGQGGYNNLSPCSCRGSLLRMGSWQRQERQAAARKDFDTTEAADLFWRISHVNGRTKAVRRKFGRPLRRGEASASIATAVAQDEVLSGASTAPEGGTVVLLEPLSQSSDLPPLLPAMQREAGRSRRWGGRGGGGRKRVRTLDPAQGAATIDGKENTGSDKLEWLTQEGVDLTSERSIWKINRAISRAGSVREALQVIEQMKAAGMNSANEGTYVALISVCRRQQQGERALTVYEAMKQAGVKPGRLTFNTLISCCQQCQRLEDAFRLKADMEAANIQPDVVTYTSLMSLVVKANPYRGRSSSTQRLDKAMDLHKEMQERGVQPDAVTFNTLMYAAAQAKLPGRVLEVYGSMVAASVPPNQFTFGILLEAVGAAGRLKSALQVFNEMKAAGVPPTTSIFNFMIDACGAAPQPDADKAWQLLEEMKLTIDCQPNAETYANVITACCKGGRHEDAMKAYQMMIDAGFVSSITASTYNRLIHSAGMTGTAEQAFAMYDVMREAGHKADAITYSSLVSACTREGDLARALVASQELEAQGVKPNQVVFHALMGAYGNADQWQDAVATYRIMVEEHKEEPPVPATFGILFDACCGKGGAEALLVERISSAQPLTITPGLRAAIGLYDEAVRMGLFHNFSIDDLTRCDIRGMSRSGTLVCILSWLEAVRKQPPVGDLMVVTGTDKGRNMLGQRRGRQPKLFLCAERVLSALGLPMQTLRTLTMVALTVEAKDLKVWLSTSTSEVAVVEKTKRRRRRRRGNTKPGKAAEGGGEGIALVESSESDSDVEQASDVSTREVAG